MGEIYCLYSTADGEPRYIGRSDDTAERRYKQHVTNALEIKPGELYDWMRAAWKEKHEIGFYVLQSDIIPADIAFFEQYWISQFPGLLNQHFNGTPPQAPTDAGRQVMLAIKAKLVVTEI